MKVSMLGGGVCGSVLLAGASALVAGSTANASFVSYVVTSTTATVDGQNLVIYTLAARFGGYHDTVFAAGGLVAANSAWFNGFWHKDNHGNPATNGMLSQVNGTWDPSKTGSASANRPYDSYLTIGSQARAGNTTQPTGIWWDGNSDASVSWARPDLPDNSGLFAWLNKESDNGQGTVGNSPGLPSTDVRLGQFVLSEGHEARTFSLTIKYGREYSLSDDHYFATGEFTLGVIPTPGALALLAASGLMARSRRR